MRQKSQFIRLEYLCRLISWLPLLQWLRVDYSVDITRFFSLLFSIAVAVHWHHQQLSAHRHRPTNTNTHTSYSIERCSIPHNSILSIDIEINVILFDSGTRTNSFFLWMKYHLSIIISRNIITNANANGYWIIFSINIFHFMCARMRARTRVYLEIHALLVYVSTIFPILMFK